MLRFLVIFTALLATTPVSAATSVKQVQQLLEQQKYVDAANAGEQLLQQSPEHARTRFLTAYAYQMSAQTDKAVMLYQDLIK
ncbi:MAG: hypothetical protein KJP11_10365, partial [Gammaproteobacteria bacterium]|nr:hypothetical protein [Gammaproteobacteria bacterium]